VCAEVFKTLHELVEWIHYWKKKWYEKSESGFGQFIETLRFDQVSDYLSQFVSFATTLSNIFDVLLSLLTAGNYDETYTGTTEFDILIPKLEEFLKGIYGKSEKVDINQLFREFAKERYGIELPPDFRLTFENVIKFLVEHPVITIPELNWQPTTEVCGVYGYARYDYSRYCKPEIATREKLKQEYVEYLTFYGSHRPAIYGRTYYDNAIYAIPNLNKILEMLNLLATVFELSDKDVKHFADVFGFSEDVLRNLLYKRNLIKALEEQCFVAGLGIAGVTSICEEVIEDGKRKFKIEVDTGFGYKETITFTCLEELLMGFFLHMSVMGFDTCVNQYELFVASILIDFIVWRIERTFDRFMTGYSAISKAQYDLGFFTWDTATKPHVYADKQFLVRTFESIVKNIVSRIVKSPFMIKQYVSFAIDLLFSRAKRHGIKEAELKELSLDQYIEFMIKKWVKHGLDENILRQIANRLRIYIPYVEKQFKYIEDIWYTPV